MFSEADGVTLLNDFAGFVEGHASARGQNHLQPTRNAIRQFLGSGIA